MEIEETAVIILQNHLLCIYYMQYERSINSAD